MASGSFSSQTAPLYRCHLDATPAPNNGPPQGSLNQQLQTPQTSEKVELQPPNDHLPSAMEKVHLLSQLTFCERSMDEDLQDGAERNLTDMSKGALRDIKAKYDDISEAEDWFMSKVSNLNQNHDALKQETVDLKDQIHPYTCIIDSLKHTIEFLMKQMRCMEKQMRDMEDRYGREAAGLQDNVARLETQIICMTDEIAHHQNQYKELLKVKMAQDVEIAATGQMLKEEESRIIVPVLNFSQTNTKDHPEATAAHGQDHPRLPDWD